MSAWKYKLRIKDEWQGCKDGKVQIHHLAKSVSKKLKAFKLHDDETLCEIINDLDMVASKGDCTAEDFDCILENLYDWADTEVAPYGQWPQNKMCWVEIF